MKFVHRSDSSSDREVAAGVADIEHISRSWSKYSLWGAWVALFILSSAVNLETQVLTVYTNYATSSFNKFSLLATLQVVQGVLFVAVRPPLASLSDYVGRFEGYLICTVFFAIGAAMLAASPNIGTYFGGQIFYICGRVGLHFMGVIFAADTSDLVHRAFFTTLPDFTNAIVPWLAAPVTTGVLNHSTWRWGIGMWAIIVPSCCVPLLVILWVTRHKSRKMRERKSLSFRVVLEQMDIGGNVLLAAALALIFVAIPLASGDKTEWSSAHIIVMLVVGILCAIAFFFYEYYIPKYPLLAYRVMNKQIGKSFFFILFYYLGYYTYNAYYFSWLRVTFDYDNSAATNINVVYTVSNTVTSVLGAIGMKYVKRIKWFIFTGASVHLLGLGLQYHYRTPDSSTVQIVFAQIVAGLGDGLLVIPNQTFVQAFCQHAETAQVTALYLAFLSLGHIIGDAVSGSIYRSKYKVYLAKFLPGHTEAFYEGIANAYTKALKYPMDSPIRQGIIKAYGELMKLLFMLPMIFYAIMVITALTYVDINLGTIDDGVKGVVFGGGIESIESKLDEDDVIVVHDIEEETKRSE